MSDQDAPRMIHQSLPSTLSAYHEFVQQILDEMKQLGWGDRVLFGVRMALEETISNAVRHGNKEDPNKQVHVECRLTPDRFWAKISDEGEGYEPESVPDCRCDENLELPGGRGLTLIRAYMTSVVHSECGRCVEIEKRLDDKASP